MLSFLRPDMIVISISRGAIFLELGMGGVPFECPVLEGLEGFPFHGKLFRPPALGIWRGFGGGHSFVLCGREGLIKGFYGIINVKSSLNRVS